MTTREQLDDFHEFAARRLAEPGCTSTLADIFNQWHDQHSRAEIDAAIRRGLADVDAGRYRPANEATESMRQEFGFTKE